MYARRGLGVKTPMSWYFTKTLLLAQKRLIVSAYFFLLICWLNANTTEWICMQISRNIVDGPKLIIRFRWESVSLSTSKNHLFLRTFRPLPMFKTVFRDSSLYAKQLHLFCLLWLNSSASGDPIGYIANFCSMMELLHDFKNSSCYHRSIQAFDNVSARKKEN